MGDGPFVIPVSDFPDDNEIESIYRRGLNAYANYYADQADPTGLRAVYLAGFRAGKEKCDD